MATPASGRSARPDSPGSGSKVATSATAAGESGRAPRVAFQGEPGAFSEEGVLSAFVAPEAVALPTWRAVFEAVNDGTADAGVVPIERSSAGSVREIYDLLFKFDELRIAAEVTVPVRLALLAIPGQTLERIERVYSIAQALDQADEFLRSRPWSVLTSYNTAGAAKSIADAGEWRRCTASRSSPTTSRPARRTGPASPSWRAIPCRTRGSPRRRSPAR